jgi:hypothetical protein
MINVSDNGQVSNVFSYLHDGNFLLKTYLITRPWRYIKPNALRGKIVCNDPSKGAGAFPTMGKLRVDLRIAPMASGMGKVLAIF